MALQMAAHSFEQVGELRIHPSPKRVRAFFGGRPIVDTTQAIVVWEPRRVVPSYAVPLVDIDAQLVPATSRGGEEHAVMIGEGPPVLDPSTGFSVHTTPGQSYDIDVGTVLDQAAFAPEDPDLQGYAVLDFAAFDEWRDEDEVDVVHPRDPFSRVECRRSSRHVVVESDGEVLADSHAPIMLFETLLPTRYYLPRDDVRMDLLTPSDSRTGCAYKGFASYFSTATVPDIAWTYLDPEHDAAPVKDLICFYNERVDITVDGDRLERPTTPWS
ncbi:DUF427 domain-containing protein [Luteipulveratus flavus]|uniref:DUF427 domain-containing protein n=1 Tax=Luteipulveratus flavus TaxID=3031728 RepID=A0ABT6C4B3_9MICO|nr:DUF427 domain-containing protein [Luteipulveratus sp. YIM 133296]MDF8263526.1 DUF427 domain-containing protein [Luteipulveratus sp. YIM 133296]